MDILSNIFIDFHQYPQNLPYPDVSTRKLKTYTAYLDANSERLFSDATSLVFADSIDGNDTYDEIVAKSLEDVERLCPLAPTPGLPNVFRVPACRFIFLHSTNSREALFATRQVLSLVLSYHTVNPWFLDFLFSFGEQDEARDSRFSSIRHKICDNPLNSLEIPRLNRTGHELHLCYNLRAAETTKTKHMPWSVRQAVLYHSFDLRTGQTFFIVLKGNDSLCRDFRNESSSERSKTTDGRSKFVDLFSVTLRTHLSFCWWACENWRPYINHLEARINHLTSQAITEKMTRRPGPVRISHPRKPRRQRTLSWLPLSNNAPDGQETARRSLFGISRQSNWASGTATGNASSAVNLPKLEFEDQSYPEIDFPDLQIAQHLEEKVNEALHALKGDIRIITALDEIYQRFPVASDPVQRQCSWFHAQLSPVMGDLETYQSALETLLKLCAERKNLLMSILEFQNMQATKYFAEKAQISADNMEQMTEEMRGLTRKTKDETLSMTVIAGVTMFFLPGTFVSTMMSTDIVKWDLTPDGSYELRAVPAARNLFLALTLPFMFVTFAIWRCVNWHSRRNEG